jgi:hypothetical protein
VVAIKSVFSLSLNRACRVAATMASLHMRTWSNALPPAHHAEAASLEQLISRDSPPCERARRGAGSSGSPYALAKKTGCPEGITARRTARAVARRGAGGKVCWNAAGLPLWEIARQGAPARKWEACCLMSSKYRTEAAAGLATIEEAIVACWLNTRMA